MDYSGNTIKKVCNVDTDLYNEELERDNKKNLVYMYNQLVSLQQKSFTSKWTNVVMRKLTRASINSPSNLKNYIVSETFNPCLENVVDSGLHLTTQKGFLALINENQDLW